jgi:hypothetical protein
MKPAKASRFYKGKKMSEVEICSLTRLGRPKPIKESHTILAFFDCLTRGLLLEGCAFVRTANKGLVA